MIRPATLVSLCLCAALGFGLFKVKYAAQALEDDLLKLNRQIAADQDTIHVLKAEWSFMTQPGRLGDLAQRHLPLQPLTAAQLGGFDTLPLRADRPADGGGEGAVPIDRVLKAMMAGNTGTAGIKAAAAPGAGSATASPSAKPSAKPITQTASAAGAPAQNANGQALRNLVYSPTRMRVMAQ